MVAETFITACGGQWLAVVVAAVVSAVVLITGDWITDWYSGAYRGKGSVNARVGASLPRWALSAAAPFGLLIAAVGYLQRAQTCSEPAPTSILEALTLVAGVVLVLIGLVVLFVRHRVVNRSMKVVAEGDIGGRRALERQRRRSVLLSVAFLIVGVALVVAAGW